jgi:hypothetical protein
MHCWPFKNLGKRNSAITEWRILGFSKQWKDNPDLPHGGNWKLTPGPYPRPSTSYYYQKYFSSLHSSRNFFWGGEGSVDLFWNDPIPGWLWIVLYDIWYQVNNFC